jgi:predicted permease
MGRRIVTGVAMSWFRRLRARLKYRDFDAQLREELDVHRAMKEADLRERGASAVEARTSASRALGNVTLAREDARGIWLAPWIESLWQDARYALRSLRKSPGFALAAILTLGFGIGLNVSVFTVFNVLALRAWDVRDPGEIVLPFARPVGNRRFSNWISYAEYVHLRDHTQTLAALVATSGGSGRVFQSEGTDYDRAYDYVQFQGASANFFTALGIDIVMGRGFLSGEDDDGKPAPVAVVTHAFWQNQLGADPHVIGRTLYIGAQGRNVPVTIIGVTRPGFDGIDRLRSVALFAPLPFLLQLDPDSKDGTWRPLEERVSVAGRLKPGISRAAAEAELDALSRQFNASAARESNGLVLTGTRPIGQPGRTDAFLPTLAGFGAAVLLVLLLACANVGNLQLARAFARQRELAVRLSLGAARTRLVRQLLTEAGCVALLASITGFGLAWYVPNIVLRFAGGSEEGLEFLPDITVFGFAMLLGAGTALLFALAPALRATRATSVLALRARTDIDRSGRRLRSALLAAQIALSLTLLVAAGLLTRGVLHAHQVDFGFDASRLGVARIVVPRDRYTGPALVSLKSELDARIAASGVGATAWANLEPLSDARFMADVRKPEQAETWNIRAFERTLSPSGFGLIGLTFVSGGPYSNRPESREAVVNETLARQLWPGEEAVGQIVVADDERYTVTGVVRDSYYTTPTAIGPLFHRAPDVTASRLVFRNDRPGAAAELQAIVQAFDSRLRVTIVPVTANVDAAVEHRRTAAGLTWAIGLLGLGLAVIGVFGVFAYAVEERRREIGIRLALGARAADVFRALFDVNRWSIGAGLTVGVLLSAAAGFVLRSYLFGLSPFDPVAYMAVSALMGLAAIVATAVPARRALRVDPAVTLKSE